eukprot:TRINITY_DN3348_c0_g1_i3.p2 TRINITY_DN3348_c0_g1~~TRINITY_DN3348_c0_g1_i3.p2  ORF type:complete len:211 (+),score=89.06 TRINITY_DN3348_c0_g1_i3:142-774(+)
MELHQTGKIGHHSFSEEEVYAYTEFINSILQNDGLDPLIPMNPNSHDLFTNLGNGLILCKLINKIQPGIIDPRAINSKKTLNIFQIKENLNLAISAAKAVGCVVVSIFPETIIEKREHMILGLIWQILKVYVLCQINLKHCPALVRLLNEGEELQDLLKLSPEDLLLRWFNYHLKAAGYPKTIKNFSDDVKDGEAYTCLLYTSPSPRDQA